MLKISKSPERNTFQATKYLERKAEEGKTPENDEDVAAMVDYYKSWEEQKAEKEADPAWQKDNLEWDLRTTDWILEKVRSRDDYAQNLYAAMCNNGFIRLEVIPVLKEEEWSCSWRYAGGIIADMRQEGDYIDWYCSGIRDIGVYAPAKENEEFTDEQKARLAVVEKYVGEGHITDEIRNDLQRLGWAVASGGDWENFI